MVMNGQAKYPPYSTIDYSIYEEEGSYSKEMRSLFYERKGYLMNNY